MQHKSIDINVDHNQWEDIVESVDKIEVPVQCLKRITIKLENGKRRQISVLKLRKQGVSDEQIEAILNHALTILGDEVKSVDFFVDVAAVAEMVSPRSKEILNILQKGKK